MPKSTQSDICSRVKQILWDSDKNSTLLKERSVCFEDVLHALEQGALSDKLDHPNQNRHPGRRIMVVAIDEYAYLVPYIETEEYLFLKTIIPSRKATKKYLGTKGDADETDD